MTAPNDRIAKVLADWDAVVETSARVARRARNLARIVAVSLVFDLGFTAALAYVTHQVQHSEQVRCLAGNDFRAADEARWEYLISLTAGPNETPAQRATTQRFEAYIVRADAPVRC